MRNDKEQGAPWQREAEAMNSVSTALAHVPDTVMSEHVCSTVSLALRIVAPPMSRKSMVGSSSLAFCAIT